MSAHPTERSLDRPRKVAATLIVAAGLGGMIIGRSAATATPAPEPERYREDITATNEFPPVMVDQRETWPLAGPDGEVITDARGRIAVIDPDQADAILEEESGGRARTRQETRVTPDGVEEDVHRADAEPYFAHLDLLIEAGAVTYLSPTSRAFDTFCDRSPEEFCSGRKSGGR